MCAIGRNISMNAAAIECKDAMNGVILPVAARFPAFAEHPVFRTIGTAAMKFVSNTTSRMSGSELPSASRQNSCIDARIAELSNQGATHVRSERQSRADHGLDQGHRQVHRRGDGERGRQGG